jgi:hypothetical protein
MNYASRMGQRVKVIVDDVDESGGFSIGDVIRILDGYVDPSEFKITYRIKYGAPLGAVRYPRPGDRFVIKTYRPFFTGDYFSFKMKAAYVDTKDAKSQLSKISVVPNPYISTAKWEPRTLYTSGRGDRKIEFKKLPAECSVRIYTIAGSLVKTLYKNSGPTDGSLAWDLITDDGMEVAFGLYIFHVDAPGIGEHIGKFAIVK